MLRAAIFGVGTWGARLVDAVQGSEKIRFVKAISRDPGKYHEFSQKTRIKVVSSYGRVLKDPEIDAVVLATPHSLHHKQIIQAARAGKHVYVEKPLALKRKNALEAVDACRVAGITLGLGFNRRYAPVFVEMMRRIKAGEIGDVLHVEGQHSGPSGYRLKAGNWRATRAEAPGGGMTARGIHTLDAMINIAGPVASVYAFSDKRKLPPEVDIDDTTSMLLRFENGVTGYLGTVFVTGDFYRVHAFGTNGWLEMRGDSELIAHGLEGAAERVPVAPADKERAMLEGFADAVAGKQLFVVPPDEIVNGIAVLEAIVASAAKGRPVKVQ
ncbi:MAG: Gfo/Idh/MocA family oxidoreductase [Betaproteobacteria bacterium]|nr:Gfo/Idh/MocA family oxidoreductase [Betaproteobacteria bacterium]MDH3437084.1 Gfo/Idh/MocA family oxidoreductase [Betaproteobacteria bacterium]